MSKGSETVLKGFLFAGMMVILSCSSLRQSDGHIRHASGLIRENSYTLKAKTSLYSGYDPLDVDGNAQVLVEIPAGTNEKWEVNKSNGKLEWEFKNDRPRIVKYLGYPGNYGMIPRTLLPEESGGDGDPLDVLVLGQAVPRGTLLKVRLIGMIRMLDGGERDDKMIAVMLDSPFREIRSLKELDQKFSGISEILSMWFSNYKGPGVMQAGGMADADEAGAVLKTAINAYIEQESTINQE